MEQVYSFIPDASLRRGLTLTDIAPLILCYYAHAVLAMLPGTYWFRVALLPLTEWLVWNAAVTFDFSKYLAGTLGLENPLRISFLDMVFDVSVHPRALISLTDGKAQLALWAIGLRCIEWTLLINKPLRRYEMPIEKKSREERPLTVSNVLVDAIDLLFNFRGLGWAWSSEPFYVDPNPPRSIPHQFFKLFVKIASLDAAHYVVQLVRPTAYRPEGDTIYDYTLDPLPHFLQVLAISVCGNGAHILLGRHHVPTPRAYRPTRIRTVPRAVAAHCQSSLARGISHGVLGEKMAPIFPPLFRRVWFATGKEGGGLVWFRHGRLPRLGAHAPRDDLGSRTRAGAATHGGLFRHAGRRHNI